MKYYYENNDENFHKYYCTYLLKRLMSDFIEIIPFIVEYSYNNISTNYSISYIYLYLHILKYIKSLGIGVTKTTSKYINIFF